MPITATQEQRRPDQDRVRARRRAGSRSRSRLRASVKGCSTSQAMRAGQLREGEEAEARVVEQPVHQAVDPDLERDRPRRGGYLNAQGARSGGRGRGRASPRAATSQGSQRRAQRPAGAATVEPERSRRAGLAIAARGPARSPSSTASTASRVELADAARPARSITAKRPRRRRSPAVAIVCDLDLGRGPRPRSRRRRRGGRMTGARREHLGPRHVAGELGDVGGRRPGHQLLGRADLDDPRRPS